MIRATSVVRRPAVRAEKVADIITLDHQARHRRRIAMTADGGLAFLLDLEKATVLADGDAVKLEDGRLVQVKAAPEALVEVRTLNPLRLMKVAWHLGNRHVPTEITEDAVYFAEDHVLMEMVRGLGAGVEKVMRPFRPEKGAYEAAEAHGHGEAGHHDHEHHDHSHHDHGHHDHGHHEHHGQHDYHGGADPQAAEPHEHGPDCGCGHDHHHDHGHDHHDAHGDHDHSHPKAAQPASSEPRAGAHVHGPGCGRDHG